MAFRAAFTRSSFRRAARPTAAPQLRQAIARRTYATGHEHAKAGGDAIWAVGAVGVTVPACWFILSNAPEPSHGHDDHGDSHGKSHVEEESKDEEEEGKSEDKPEEKSEEKSEEPQDDKKDDKNSGKSEDSDSDSGDEGKDADTPETSDDEGDGEPKKDEGEKKGDNTKKVIPDAKGGKKLRLESDKGTPAGAVDGPGATSGKNSDAQENLSNTDTKHSTDITNDPKLSKKGEPQSAKAKGSVEPKH